MRRKQATVVKRMGSFTGMLLLLLAAHAQEQEKPNDYVIYQRNPLAKKLNGVNGEIQLLQDARLSAELREKTWGRMPIEMAELENPASPFKGDPARCAILRIVDRVGRVTEEKRLDKPLASMKEANLYGDDRITYLVSVDYSAGWGSYSGPITSLMEVAGGKLKWLEAVDEVTGQPEPINVMSSLKTAWKVTDAPRGTAKDILQIACRPDWSAPVSSVGDVDFFLIYTRYSFNGKTWVISGRREKGLAELDELDALLDRKPFP